MLFFLIFIVCLLLIGATVAALMLTKTPRYRTQAEDLLTLFDAVLESRANETQWQTLIGFPIRHDEYLEGVRRRSVYLMDHYGQPWIAAQGGCLLSKTGHQELTDLRQHLAAHTSLNQHQVI